MSRPTIVEANPAAERREAPHTADRLAYIDGLRAIAVLAVVVNHAARNSGYPGCFTSTLNMGKHGVDLFFVISGFCLAYPTLARIHDKGISTFDVAGFAARRLVRIFPPYCAAVALLLSFMARLRLLHLGMPEPMLLRDVSPCGRSAGTILR